MTYNQIEYSSAKKKSTEFVNGIIDQYIQSKPEHPSLIDCWEYLMDIFHLTGTNFIETLSEEEKKIVNTITLSRFPNSIHSLQTFPTYLKNRNFDEKLKRIGVNI